MDRDMFSLICVLVISTIEIRIYLSVAALDKCRN